jgi:hypothetical protein
MDPGQDRPDLPAAWWETPRRSALRAGCWLVAAGWAVAAVWRLNLATYEAAGSGVIAECRPNTAPLLVEILVAGLGIGLLVHALNVTPGSVRRRAAVVVAVAAAWGVLAFAWLPTAAHTCLG